MKKEQSHIIFIMLMLFGLTACKNGAQKVESQQLESD